MFRVPLAISDNFPTYHQEYVGENISKKKLLHVTLLSIFGNFNYSLLENTSNVFTQTFLLEICHLVQAITPRFSMLQLILS